MKVLHQENPESKRLVFMFVTKNGLIKQKLWEDYFKAADRLQFEVFLYSIGDSPELDITNLTRFPNTLNPEYGHYSYVKTVLMLLEHGLENSKNYKFILLSESCIPLTSFQMIYEKVMEDDKSYLYHFQVGNGDEASIPDFVPTEYFDLEGYKDPELFALFHYFFSDKEIKRTNSNFGRIGEHAGIERDNFHKFLAQGICFERGFVEFLVETSGDLDDYKDVRFIEEYYYLCPLNKRNIPFSQYITRKSLMSVTWRGSRPRRYTDVTPVTRELVDQMRHWGFYFMRKVGESCNIDEKLTEYIINSNNQAR